MYSNGDIDESRSYLNWDLTPEHEGFIPTATRECDQKLEYFESLKEDNIFTIGRLIFKME